jgi:hypothetical protein
MPFDAAGRRIKTMSGMSRRDHFTAKDLPFRDQDGVLLHQRTRAAFEHGVRAAALGEALIYQGSQSDYALAERQGRDAARRELLRGRPWLCGECKTMHFGPNQEEP